VQERVGWQRGDRHERPPTDEGEVAAVAAVAAPPLGVGVGARASVRAGVPPPVGAAGAVVLILSQPAEAAPVRPPGLACRGPTAERTPRGRTLLQRGRSWAAGAG